MNEIKYGYRLSLPYTGRWPTGTWFQRRREQLGLTDKWRTHIEMHVLGEPDRLACLWCRRGNGDAEKISGPYRILK